MENLEGAQYFSLGAAGRLSYPQALVRLATRLRRERVDILQTHLFDAGIVGLIAARLARIPVVVLTRHHLDQVHLIGNRFHVFLDRWMARNADHVVVLSNAVRNFMISADGIDASKVEVIHQGFDFEKLSVSKQEGERVRAEFNFGSRFVIGTIAQLFETKGQKYLLKALSEVSERMPDAHLFFVGGGDPKPLELLAGELGLNGRVTFAGYRKDVPACISAMDLIVHPSLSEAFCQVLIETMAAGRPIISTDVGGAREVIDHDKTGLLVPPSDAPAIARALLDLYQAPEKRAALAKAGQTSVYQRFPVSLMVEHQVNCYKRWFAQA
jgi:glycosyltransferase involved in cell wall biosynthesis